jgi:undecaprenyl-diphosphatase
LAAYAELAEDLRISPVIYAFDTRLTAVIEGWRTPLMTSFFSAVTWSASSIPVAVAAVAAIGVLLWLGRQPEALFVAITAGGGTVLGTVAKRVTARPRPPVAHALIELPVSFSFPSGHVLAAVLLWSIVVIVVWRTTRGEYVRWLAVGVGVALAALTGVSRVYLGVHWPSDVLASWLLGVAWLSLCFGALVTWERATQRAEAAG